MYSYKGVAIPEGKKVGKNKGVMRQVKANKREAAEHRANRREFAIERLQHDWPGKPWEKRTLKTLSTNDIIKIADHVR